MSYTSLASFLQTVIEYFTRPPPPTENYMVVGPHLALQSTGKPIDVSHHHITARAFEPTRTRFVVSKGVPTDSAYVHLYTRMYGRIPPTYENGLAFHRPGISISSVPQNINVNDGADRKIRL